MALKSGFSLPLGPFQIHLPATVIVPAARRMGDALERLREAIESQDNLEKFNRIADEVRASGDAMRVALNSLESRKSCQQ